MEETMTILNFENDPERINALEEMEIMKETTSSHMLNIIRNINPLNRMLQPVQDHTKTCADDCWWWRKRSMCYQHFNEEGREN